MKKDLNFIGKSKVFFGISLAIIAIGLICNIIFGATLDIQFKGGTIVNYSYTGEIDADALYDERAWIAERINTILLHNLRNNIRFCRICGAALPLHHQGSLCSKCFRSHAGVRRFRP